MPATIWGGLFLFYRCPGGGAVVACVLVLWIGTAALAGYGIWVRRWRWSMPLALGVTGLVAWLNATTATNAGDWAVDVSRPLTATIEPDRIIVHDVRDFRWRSEADFTPRWEERHYDLADLVSLDLVNSYWTGPLIAHTLLSFGFRDGRHLAFSIEIRRRADQDFSNLAGFFAAYGLVFIAADERDILFLRTNIRREDVQLYPLILASGARRALLVDLLERANELAARPDFYNTLIRNCTTVLFDAARDVIPSLPFDWRIILSGFVPDYVYDRGLLGRSLSLPEQRTRSHVSPAGLAGADGEDYSRRIRRSLVNTTSDQGR